MIMPYLIVVGCWQDKAPRIQALINKTFDRSGAKVVIEPIVVSGNYAIADWVQGEKAGRALLKLNNGEWQLWACGGKGMKTANALVGLGVPGQDAANLTSKLSSSENNMGNEQIRLFDDFGTIMNFLADTALPHHH